MTTRAQPILRTPDVWVRTLTLGPGEVVPWHYHTAVDDVIVCLSGQIEVRLRAPSPAITLNPGQRTTVTAGATHRVANLADTESEYLLIQGVGSYDFIATET